MRWTASTEDHRHADRSRDFAPGGSVDLALTGETHQTINGFGGCFNELGYEALRTLPEAGQEAVMRALFATEDGLGFSYCRMPIGASDYARSWYSLAEVDGDFELEHFSIDRDQGCLIPYIRQALKLRPDLRIFGSPWSPPAWMKTHKTFNNGRLRWEEPVLRAYALYFQKYVEAYRAEGIPVTQVFVQNEPNSDQKFPSCCWTAERMRDFIRDYLGPQFAAAGLDCEIWAGTIERATEHGWLADSVGTENYARWAGTILADPEARKFISGVGYQWEGKGAVEKTHRAWPELPIVQTENECGDGKNTWRYAEYVFDLVWHYMQHGTVAYIYWNMILPPGGESTWGWNQNALITIDPDSGEVTQNPEYCLFRHLAPGMVPGSRRLGLTGEWCVFSLAFERPDGECVLVLHNPFHEARTVSIDLDGDSTQLDLAPHSFNSLRWS